MSIVQATQFVIFGHGSPSNLIHTPRCKASCNKIPSESARATPGPHASLCRAFRFSCTEQPSPATHLRMYCNNKPFSSNPKQTKTLQYPLRACQWGCPLGCAAGCSVPGLWLQTPPARCHCQVQWSPVLK